MCAIANIRQPVVLIGGAGCVGKSTFASELQGQIERSSTRTVSVLDLDCYLVERHRRETPHRVVTGYDPAAYHIEAAVKDIETLLAGRAIRVSPYDKPTSQKGKDISINPADVLVVEGVMALTDPIRKFKSVAIFMDAHKEVLYANRLARETSLGFDMKRIERKFQGLSQDYTRFIQPQRDRAEMLIEIGDRYSFLQVLVRGAA